MKRWIKKFKDWYQFRKYHFIVEVFINNEKIKTLQMSLIEMMDKGNTPYVNFYPNDKCEIWITNLVTYEKILAYKYENGKHENNIFKALEYPDTSGI